MTALRTLGPRAERALLGFARDNATLLAVAMTFAVLAYGYALVNPSLSLDEESAPTFAELGHGNGWSLALYRWGLVAFQTLVVGGGTLPFLRPLLALLVLSVAAVAYARLLPTTRVAQHFFALVFVTVPTFAFTMTFSFMCIESALAILLWVLGLRCFVAACARPTPEPRLLAGALGLWVLAPSLYQDYGVLLTAFLVETFFRLAGGEAAGLVRRAAWFAAVVAVAVALYALISIAIAHAFGMPGVRYMNGYLGAERGWPTVGRFIRSLRGFYFGPAVYGTSTVRLAAIALPVLAAWTDAPLRRRIALTGLAVAIAVAPLAYGLGVVPPLRAASGLLFVGAAAAAFAVARSGPASAFFVKVGMVWLALCNCVAVNNIFHYESLAWDADRLLATNLAQRIHDVAPDVHDRSGVRVVFAGSYRQPLADTLPDIAAELWVGMFDTWGENRTERRRQALLHLGFPDFVLGSPEDYARSEPRLESMPTWPARGSVARDGDLVLVKLGPLNGFGTQ